MRRIGKTRLALRRKGLKVGSQVEDEEYAQCYIAAATRVGDGDCLLQPPQSFVKSLEAGRHSGNLAIEKGNWVGRGLEVTCVAVSK